MDSGTSISIEEFRKVAAQKAAEEKSVYRSEQVDAGDSTQLLWTALLPGWTVPLAEASGFPVKDVAGYFEDLREQKIVERSRIVGESNESQITVYSMDGVARQDVIDAYVDNSQTFYRLTLNLGLIGSSILEATGLNTQLSNPSEHIFEKLSIATPAMARFAVLAAHATNRPSIVSEFEKRVEAAFLRRESASIRDWINTAFPFSTLFLRLGDDSMKQALQRASQRLILLRREEIDRRHLKHFYERSEQFEAFKDLMTGDDSSWALHFLGAGGVGKTMLVRKITVDWAREFDAVAARVDFDYLKAEYPTLDPGMLLWAFAQELRAYAGPDSLRLFNKAERKFEELRSQIQSEARSGLRQRATDYPDFAEAISDYCDALRLIPKRVLLIVDTCEELAKIGIGLTPVENIHETFRILRALHDGAHTLKDASAEPSKGLASLRVIFSGRRPLASAGEHWSCPSASQLDPRPFLKLQPVRGFTKAEAESFLREKLNVDQSLIPAIITRSPDTGNVAKIERTDSKDEPSRNHRSNPYDLKLYADWTKEDPPPTATQILETPPATQYVELRVIRRLHEESLKEALPAVALLGHFDKRLLQHTFGDKKTPEQIERLFELLQQEEWINQRNVQDEDEGSNLILDIEPGIRTRLFVYYKDSPLLRDFQPRAADYLEKLTLEGDPSRHDWSLYDAALTVLEADPDRDRLVRWWRQVDERMFSQCLPEWIKNATNKMQNEGGAAAQSEVPPESRLRPAVLATYASARLRSTPRGELGLAWRDLKDLWSEVLKKCSGLATEMPGLELRARAGLISASLRSGEVEPVYGEINRLWGFLLQSTESLNIDERFHLPAPLDNRQMLASVVAAVEAIVEYADVMAVTKAPMMLTILANTLLDGKGVSALRKLFSPKQIPRAGARVRKAAEFRQFRQMVSFGLCLVGRVEAMVLKEGVAKNSFLQALDLCRFDDKTLGNSRPWLDWIPPEDVASRVRLEFIRSTYAHRVSVKESVETLLQFGTKDNFLIDSKLLAAPVRLKLVDNDRLHSAFLQLLSGLEPIDKEEITRYERELANASTDVNPKSERSGSRSDPAQESQWTCLAHQLTPPLFVTLAELRAEKGDADEVLTNLASILGSRSGVSYRTQLHIDRVSSKIIRRFRLRDVGEKGGQMLAVSSEIEDRALAWELDAQDGARVQQVIPTIPDALINVEIKDLSHSLTANQIEKLKWLHAIWQTRYAGDRDSAITLLQWAEQNLKGYLDLGFVSHSYEVVSVQLDCLEALQLASRYRHPVSLRESRIKYDYSNLFSPEQYLTLQVRIGALENEKVLRDNISHPTVVLLGRRRVAEIVAHEADLLALRLPDRAAPLYHCAQEWFGWVRDPHSEFIAGTSEAMCLPPNKVKLVSEWTTHALEKIKVPFKGPSVLIRDRDTPAENWTPRCWRPRMTRYLLLVTAETEKNPAAVGKEVIEAYLPGAVAVSSTGPEKVSKWSADLATWLTNASHPPGLFSRLSKIGSVIKDIFRVLFGIALFLTMIGLLFRGFRWAFSFVVPSYPARNQWLQFLTLGLFVTTITLAIRLAIKVRERKAVPTVNESSSSDTGESKADEYPTWRIWVDFALIWVLVAVLVGPYFTELVQRWGWRLLGWLLAVAAVSSLIYVFRGRFSRLVEYLFEIYRFLFSIVYTKIFKLKLEIYTPQAGVGTREALTDISRIDILLRRVPKSRLSSFIAGSKFLARVKNIQRSASTPYEELIREHELTMDLPIPAHELTEAFLNLRLSLRDYPLMVEINVPEGPVNGLCWEAFVLSSYFLNADYTTFTCYRRPASLRRSARTSQHRLIGLLFAETAPARTLRSAWAPTNDFEIANRERLVSGGADVSIVHLVGSAESSYQSVGFRLGEETAHLDAATSETITERDALIRAEDLVRAFPNLQICIVQQEPRAIQMDRFDGDRKDAFYARLFGSQLSTLGVACVLTIPPLEKDFVLDLMTKFANVLTRPKVDRSELLRVVAESREQIEACVQRRGVDLTTKHEVPMDLCLFLDPEWDGRIKSD
jgi:hypothetical protein